MNKWIGQLLFAIITASTVVIAWYQYEQSQKEIQSAEKKDLIFPEWNNQVADKIHIRYGKKTIQLVRGEHSLWRLLSPLKDIADGSAVAKWLDQVFSEKAKILNENSSSAHPPSIDWSEYGLSSSNKTREIKITSQSQAKFRLLISDYSAFDGRFFLKKTTDRLSHLLLGSTAWAGLTQKTTDYFRSYRLLNITQRPLSIEYQSKKFKAHFKREKNTWKWANNNPKKFPLSQSELEGYVIDLTTAKFKKTNIYPNNLTYRKKYKLFKPTIQIRLNFNKEPLTENNNPFVWHAKLFKKGKQYYVLVSTRNYIFTLKSEDVEKILLTEKKIQEPPKELPKQINKKHSPKDKNNPAQEN